MADLPSYLMAGPLFRDLSAPMRPPAFAAGRYEGGILRGGVGDYKAEYSTGRAGVTGYFP